MSTRDIGDVQYGQLLEEYMSLFDDLDLDQKSHRRLAVWILDDSYRRILCGVGREYLGFSSAKSENRIDILWRKTLDRFESLETFEEPTEKTSNIKQIHDFRNKISHNTDYDPPQSNLEEIRSQTSDWLDWMLPHAHQYHSDHEEMTSRELMIVMAKRSLDRILSETEDSDFDAEFGDWSRGIRDDAERLKADIEVLEDEGPEISVELVDVLVDAIELAQNLEKKNQTEAKFWSMIDDRVDEMRLENR